MEKDEITIALEEMIFVWDTYKNYASSKTDWERHYNAAINLQRLYRVNMNKLIDDPTTPRFMENLQHHIEKLEVYRDYGLLVNE